MLVPVQNGAIKLGRHAQHKDGAKSSDIAYDFRDYTCLGSAALPALIKTKRHSNISMVFLRLTLSGSTNNLAAKFDSLRYRKQALTGAF